MRASRKNFRNNVSLTVLCMLVSVACSVGASQLPSIEVALKQEADVTSHLIRLSEVGEVILQEPELREVVSSLTIGVAPALCRDTLLHADVVEKRLQEAFPNRRVEVTGATIVRVKRTCRDISEKELARIGEEFIREHMDWQEADVEIQDVKTIGVELPGVDISYAVSASPNEDYLGPVSLEIMLKHDGEVLRRLRWRGWVAVMTNAVVASRTLDRNEIVRDGDVRIDRLDLSRLHTSTLASLTDVVGKRVTRRIAEGAVLTPDDLDRPLWVTRGASVLIVAQSPWFRVTTKGLAREDGARGEEVRVLNISSKREVVGKVVGPQTVKVAF
ncbi:MAG: flagellar basal body P-ring formation protein FlgA [Deltaproteobacteria bacterium]|nr:flagellar basal body P-ring formation protein FlgA [Deltaproteobacteria bacterium]